ncbi:MAG: ABC transporter ATP-binding protein [Bacteroidota bacterium]|nr:ABC transporter ATP-binding protein [Bacteroidota bacterium]
MKKENLSTKPGLLSLLRPYSWFIALLVVLTIVSNGLNLVVPKIISHAIDSYSRGNFSIEKITLEFLMVSISIFIFTYLQSIVQTYTAETVAKNLRTRLAAKISVQDHAYIQRVTPSKLLTNLTSDVDAVKMFVAQAISSIVSSAFLIIGACILLMMINWRLALAALAVLPIIGIAFYVVMKKVRKLFKRSQEVIDWLNKVINESILGAALIRLLNSNHYEYEKFLVANIEAREVSLSILRLFASLIPVISFAANLSVLIILALGGKFVIEGSMSLGNFMAFNSYLAILIFPIIVIGFMSNVIAQASASYQRVCEVLLIEDTKEKGRDKSALQGGVSVKNVFVEYAGKAILKDVSFEVKPGSRTAVIGPTAAGKTQLLYLLTGLNEPSRGRVEYDDKNITAFDAARFHEQVGLVFQDSIIFNMSLRENIAFSNKAEEANIAKAINTAELRDFVDALPEKLDTIVSERGTSLSGGQKQRIMLARALALDPKILLLDDFTARLDTSTEKKILKNVHENYPGITIISVTQKIESIEDYDQIILLMEGEVLAEGTHSLLLENSPEYVQIYNSQRSTNQYELQAQ